ncbi:MAG: class I SAM-dependent methyltransferase [Lachnospiraceae bacterium]|nr:class I SAM-dependent methyltransferase [Lachnospiraceae bacterium]
MASYESFAEVYDMYMDNVDYEQWCQNLIQVLNQYQIDDGLVAELGCGTGKMTRALRNHGFDMIGIDNSYDMLGIAMSEDMQDILYLCQDMREFELYGTVRAVVSVCDSMNYIVGIEDLTQVISLANNYLDPKGIFIFDMNTIYKYEHILADNTFAENRDEGSFIWENEYDKNSQINEYDLTLYIADEENDDASDTFYQRYEEQHIQRAYTIEEIKQAVAAGGMVMLDILDVDTMDKPTDTTERIYVIAQERGKEI